MMAPSFQLPHYAIGSLAEPDPFTAFVGAGLLFLPGRSSWRVIAPTLPPSARIWISEYLSASAEYRARLSSWLVGRF